MRCRRSNWFVLFVHLIQQLISAFDLFVLFFFRFSQQTILVYDDIRRQNGCFR